MKRILLAGILLFLAASPVASFATKDADQATEQKTSTLAQVILEEYKAVREEIILSLGERVTIVSFGFAAVGALLAGGVAALSGERQHWYIAAMVIGVGVSLTSLYVLDVWNAESQRLARASYYNYSLEVKLQKLYPGDVVPLEWEHRVRSTDEAYAKLKPSDQSSPWVFLFISAFSTLGGFYLFLRGTKVRVYRLGIPIFLVVVLPLLWQTANHYRTLKSLDELWNMTPH